MASVAGSSGIVDYVASLGPFGTQYVLEWWSMTGSHNNAQRFAAELAGRPIEQLGRATRDRAGIYSTNGSERAG